MKLAIFCGLTDKEYNEQLQSLLSLSKSVVDAREFHQPKEKEAFNINDLLVKLVKDQSVISDKVLALHYQGEISELSVVEFGDIETHFVLFYEAPEYAVLSSLDSDTVEADTDCWLNNCRSMFALYLKQMANAQLMNKHVAFLQPDKLKQKLKDSLYIDFQNSEDLDLAKSMSANDLVYILRAHSLLDGNNQVQSIFEQMGSAADLFDEQANLDFDKRRVNYFNNLSAKISAIEVVNMQLQSQVQKLDGQRSESVAEEELKLLQIHQLQEELEQSVLKGQKLAQENEVNIKDNKALEVEKKELQFQFDQLKSQHRELETEAELSLHQIHHLQEELEQSALKAQTLAQENEVNITANKALEVDREELQTQFNQLKSQHSELVTEAELSLLQIHQFQEELELYYLKSQMGGLFKGFAPSKINTPIHRQESLQLLKILN